ncbi:hypothetical protein MP638_000936 [Amoeboaphelidium occidentale]|nr:hypothetical protein MP638_000936 [Amoeboaphelidium occidentale]
MEATLSNSFCKMFHHESSEQITASNAQGSNASSRLPIITEQLNGEPKDNQESNKGHRSGHTTQKTQASQHHPQEIPSSGFISINVGGRIFHTTVETLRLIPPMPSDLSNVVIPAISGPLSPVMKKQADEEQFSDQSPSSPPVMSPSMANSKKHGSLPPSFFSLLLGNSGAAATASGYQQNQTANTSIGDSTLKNNSQGTLNSHLSQYSMQHHGGLLFYKNIVTRDHDGNLFLDRDPAMFEHILTYLRTGQVFIDEGSKTSTLVTLQRLKAEAEFFLLDHLIQIIDMILEQERDNTEKELQNSNRAAQEDWMEYRVMTVSDVANSTFLSLLNSGKGWKIERMFTESKVVFKCPTCVQLFAGGSSSTAYFPNGAVIPCQCAIKHEKSAWVSEQIQRALLVRKKGVTTNLSSSSQFARK